MPNTQTTAKFRIEKYVPTGWWFVGQSVYTAYLGETVIGTWHRNDGLQLGRIGEAPSEPYMPLNEWRKRVKAYAAELQS